MTHKPRNTFWLIVSISGICALGWYTTAIEPSHWISITLFFLLLFLTLFSLLLFIINHTRRALLVSSGIIIFLLLRYFGLRHILYPILLFASLISLEVVVYKR